MKLVMGMHTWHCRFAIAVANCLVLPSHCARLQRQIHSRARCHKACMVWLQRHVVAKAPSNCCHLGCVFSHVRGSPRCAVAHCTHWFTCWLCTCTPPPRYWSVKQLQDELLPRVRHPDRVNRRANAASSNATHCVGQPPASPPVFVAGSTTGSDSTLTSASAWSGWIDAGSCRDYDGPVHDSSPLYTATASAATTSAEAWHPAPKPAILCEYSHAMGCSNGALYRYWDAFRRLPQLQGGFVWDWFDQVCRAGYWVP